MSAAWRIVKRRFSKTAFSGDGARLYGGRWNSPGKRAVYLAGTQSLAILEMLVHLESAELLTGYVLFRVEIDPQLIRELSPAELPRTWRSWPVSARTQSLGDQWLERGASAVLQVPSVIAPDEKNYLLNPAHPDFPRLRISAPAPFRFDKRLL